MMVAGVSLAFAAATLAAPAREKIRIGIEDNSPPMSFVNQQLRPVGFSADLLRELERTGNVEFEIVASSWTFILQEFNAGRLDALANVAILPERRATMEFSVSHAYLHAIAFTRGDAPEISRVKDLAGRRIAVVRGALSYLHATEQDAWGGVLVPLDTRQETFKAVHDGTCDLALHMRPAHEQVAADLGLRINYVEDLNYTFHIAVHKGDAARLERINQALAIVLRDEVFDELYARWIGPLQPRDLRWVDVREYVLSVGVGIVALVAILIWQQRVIRARTRAERALRETEARFRSVVESMAEGMVLQDATGRIVATNQAARLIEGRTHGEMVGHDSNDPMWGAVHEDGSPFPGDTHPSMVTLRTGRPQHNVVMGIRQPSGARRWISINSQPITAGGNTQPQAVVTTFHDITEAKLREQEFVRLNRLYATISRVNYCMVQIRERSALFREICRILAEAGGFKVACVAWYDAETKRLEPVAVAGDTQGYIAGIKTDPDTPEGKGPTAVSFRTGVPYICNDFMGDPATGPWQERARRNGFQSAAALPIRSGKQVVAMLVVFSGELGYFGAEEVKVLEETVRDLSFALDVIAAEERRHRGEAMLASILNSVPQAVFWKDRQCVYLGCNEAFARSAGLASAAVIVGKTDYDLPWVREDADQYRRDDIEVMAGGQAKMHIIERLQLPNGRQRWIDTSKIPLHDSAGEVYGVLGVFEDITERKRLDDALRESRAETLAVVNSTSDFIWSVDPERFAVVTCNRAFQDYFRSNRGIDEVVGKTPEELVPPEYVDLWRRMFEQARRTGSFSGEYNTVAGGTTLLISINAMKRGPETFGLSVFGRDVTELKRVTGALQQSEALFRGITEHALSGIYIVQAGKLSYVNPAMAAIFGYAQAELSGASPMLIVHPDDHALVRENLRRRFAGEVQALHYSLKGQHRSGKSLMIEVMGATMEINGQPAIVGNALDITDRHRAEMKLRQLSRIVEQAPLSIVITDLEGRIEYVNPKFCAVTGYAEDEVLGRNPRILKSGTTPPEVYRDMWATLVRGATWSGDLYNRRKDGEIYLETIVIAPVTDADGRATHYVSIKDDITARKRFEAESQAKLEREHEISVMKSRFISIASHEFRTPLAAVRVSADLLRNHDAKLTPAQREELLGRVDRSVRRLTGMLDEILLLNRMDADRFVLHLAPYNVRQLGQDIVEEHRVADQGAHRIEYFVEGREEPFPTDSTAFRHILTNLLGNAVKYSPPKTTVSLRVRQYDESLELTVDDRGIGLPPELIPRIFEPFERGANTGLVKGTGLGLNIAKRMADLLGATITAENRPDGGARFTARFPRLPIVNETP